MDESISSDWQQTVFNAKLYNVYCYPNIITVFRGAVCNGTHRTLGWWCGTGKEITVTRQQVNTHLWQTHTASPATYPAINSLHSVPLGPTPIPTYVGGMHAGSIYSGSILIMTERINFSLQTPWSNTGEKTRVYSSFISALDGGTWPSSRLDNHGVTDWVGPRANLTLKTDKSRFNPDVHKTRALGRPGD